MGMMTRFLHQGSRRRSRSPTKPCCLCYDEKEGHADGMTLLLRGMLSEVGLENDLTFCPFCLDQLQGMVRLRREMDRLEKRLGSMISGLQALLGTGSNPVLTHNPTIRLFEGTLGTSSLQPCKQEGLDSDEIPMDIVTEPALDFVYEEPVFDEEKWTSTQNPLATLDDPEVPHKRYDCPACGQCFTHASHLKKHSVVHTGDKPYSCELCPQSFSQKGSLNRHMTQHSQDSPFVCPDCDRAFKNASRLKDHSKTHDPLRERESHACNLCSMTFSKRSILKRHALRHVDRPLDCDFCESRFKDKEALEIHVVKWHSTSSVLEGTFFPCPKCPKSFPQKWRMERHAATHDEGPKKPNDFQCPQCPTSFPEKWRLYRHRVASHSSEVPTFPCLECPKTFPENWRLQRHAATHVGPRREEASYGSLAYD